METVVFSRLCVPWRVSAKFACTPLSSLMSDNLHLSVRWSSLSLQSSSLRGRRFLFYTVFFARKTPFDFCYCCAIHDAYHTLCRDREKSQCFFLRVFNECEVINIFSCISCFCLYRLYNVGSNFTDGKCTCFTEICYIEK